MVIGRARVNSAEVARQFNLANVLRFEDAPGGLIRGLISSPLAEAEIYLRVLIWLAGGVKDTLRRFLSARKACLRPERQFAPGSRLSFHGLDRAQTETGPHPWLRANHGMDARGNRANRPRRRRQSRPRPSVPQSRYRGNPRDGDARPSQIQ